jgi:preprotein translocase subunit YajC
MFETITTLAMMPQGGGGEDSGSPWTMMIMFGAIIAVMYFLIIRPQQKRQKDHQKLIDGVKHGDKIITSAGIHGTVTKSSEKTVEVQIADNTKITVEKSAIASVK